MKKKFWILLSGVILCCAMLALNVSAAAWDGTAADGFAGGTGTEEDPYQIATAEQLAYLAQSVNGGTTYQGKYIKLTADIVLNNTVSENWTLTAKKWTPIGTYTDNTTNAPFSGIFDGGSHTISGLYIYALSGTTWMSYQGLFGYTYNAEFKDVTIANADITGADYIGALVGYAYYFVENADAAYTLSGCIVKDSSVIGDVCVGGLVGMGYRDVQGNYNAQASLSFAIDSCMAEESSVLGVRNVGGIIGDMGKNVSSNKYATTYATITDCMNSGSISTIGSAYVGGIVGFCNSDAAFTDCTNSGNVASDASTYDLPSTGGVVGFCNFTVTFTNCTNSGAISTASSESSSYTGGIVGNCESAAAFIECKNNGDVSSTSSYSTTAGGIAGYCKSAAVFTDCTNNSNISSTTSATLGGIVGRSTRNSSFTNCTNSGKIVSTSNAGGIAGSCDSSIFTDCINSGDVFSTNSSSTHAGGIAGYGSGRLTSCINSGDMVSTSSASSAYAGGIAGYWYGSDTFTDCTNSGNVSSTTASSSATYAGGIAGYLHGSGTIKDCTNSGNILSSKSYAGGISGYVSAGSTIEKCYNIGSMTAPTDTTGNVSNVGGIVGFAAKSAISNCFNIGAFYGYTNVGGIVGYIEGGESKAEAFVYNCYNLGSVNGMKFSDSIPAAYIGAIVGQISQKVQIAACYYLNGCVSDDLGNIQNGIGSADCTAPAMDTVGVTVACTDAQMQQQTIYTGFDFTEIWTMGNAKYPYPVFRKMVAAIPLITEQTSSLDCRVGEDVVLAVSASIFDDGVLSYQWYISDAADAEGRAIDGAISAAYAPSTEDVGIKYYYVIITNTLEESTASAKSNVIAVEVEPNYILGDVNNSGFTDTEDSRILAQYFAGYDVDEEFVNQEAADVNGDGMLTRADAMILARHLDRWAGYDNLFSIIP